MLDLPPVCLGSQLWFPMPGGNGGQRSPRPRIKTEAKSEIYELRSQGLSMEDVALKLGISHATVSRVLAKMGDPYERPGVSPAASTGANASRTTDGSATAGCTSTATGTAYLLITSKETCNSEQAGSSLDAPPGGMASASATSRRIVGATARG